MNLFVAADWKYREQAREVMRKVSAMGHVVTCDWTREVAHSAADQARIAERDEAGVRAADGLLALMVGPGPYRGVWFEIGLARGLGLPVAVIGMARKQCVYGYLRPLISSSTLSQALMALESEYCRRGGERVD
jgi:nucleoside 2-deoxyribosyltransferase